MPVSQLILIAASFWRNDDIFGEYCHSIVVLSSLLKKMTILSLICLFNEYRRTGFMSQIKFFVVVFVIHLSVLPRICLADRGDMYLIYGMKWNDFQNHFGSNFGSDLSIGVGFDLNTVKASQVEFIKTNFKASSSNTGVNSIIMNELNYISIHEEAYFDILSTVGFTKLKFGAEGNGLLNFGVGVSHQLREGVQWKIQIKKLFPSNDLASFSSLQLGFNLAYKFGNRNGRRDAPRYGEKAGETNNDNELSSAFSCKGFNKEARVCFDKNKALISDLEGQGLVFYFDFDQVKIDKKYDSKIKALVLALERHPDLDITLQGHTDSVGMKKYNQKLSEKRAIQVRNVMINRFGASPDRILALGFGEDRPTEENTSRDGRARNRRVVIVGLKTKISVGF